MRKGWKLCLLAIAVAAIGGCNQMGVQQQDERTTYEAVRDQFAAEPGYEFYGRTKLLSGNSANGNVVNFSGRKDGEAVYMNVKLSEPELNRVRTISLLAQGSEKIFAKQEQDTAWRSGQGQEAALRQELNNWDPAYAFTQMDEMRQSISRVHNERTDDDVEAIQVVLDSAKLKQWLATQLAEQQGTQIQSMSANALRHRPSVKLAWALSTGGGAATERAGMSIQSANANLGELIDRMEVEAAYTIYYRKSTRLPTSITMSIRSSYDYNNQRIQEHSQVETYLQNYGRVKPVPNP
ncbi:hypothetical protein ACAF76_005520 [Brevibacillus sp. TJ4]|uniref:hypothetical protein n=1 Tax=Brevibacillus sp. TJ4 TaxID=3234853 RepID=UPI003B9E4F4E